MYNKVYVEITNICNVNCSFCHGHSRAPRQMSEDEFKSILASIKGQTEYVYYHLMGEPLTHPLLPRFLELAKTGGFKSIITTNGTLHPTVFLSYEREAYYAKDGSNFRITFDDNILCRQEDLSLQSDSYAIGTIEWE